MPLLLIEQVSYLIEQVSYSMWYSIKCTHFEITTLHKFHISHCMWAGHYTSFLTLLSLTVEDEDIIGPHMTVGRITACKVSCTCQAASLRAWVFGRKHFPCICSGSNIHLKGLPTSSCSVRLEEPGQDKTRSLS